jgi:hypothetical protein
MKRRIVVDRGGVALLARKFGCTREMASKSLNFQKNSLLARKIRYVAKNEYGGIEIGE